MSLRDKNGKNIFAVSDEEAKSGGRKGAQYEDTKYLSQEGEFFLAGVLEGLPDSEAHTMHLNRADTQSCLFSVPRSTRTSVCSAEKSVQSRH